jgi:micrococcal nuclease
MASIGRFAALALIAALGSAAPSALLSRVSESRPAEPAPELAASLGGAAYRAEVLHVIDGDTVEVKVALWLDQHLVTKVRLRGIDAPEVGGACDAERRLAIASRERVIALLKDAPVLVSDVSRDKFGGRVIARVSAHGADVGHRLVGEGLARVYRNRRESWC